MIIYETKEYQRAIIIGDVHQCAIEFQELLEKTFKPNSLIIQVGDIPDRGPDIKTCIKLCIQYNIVVIKGNHCDKWVRFKTNQDRELSEPGYKNKMRHMHPLNKKAFDSLSEEEHLWLKNLPNSIGFEILEDNRVSPVCKYLVVHGGFTRGSNPLTQDPKITCRLRYVDKTTGYMKVNREDFTKQPPHSVYWTEYWDRPERVIYGHEARDEVDITNGCYGIDTSAVYGNKLTAMIIDSNNNISFESVPAKQAYWSKQIGLHD